MVICGMLDLIGAYITYYYLEDHRERSYFINETTIDSVTSAEL